MGLLLLVGCRAVIGLFIGIAHLVAMFLFLSLGPGVRSAHRGETGVEVSCGVDFCAGMYGVVGYYKGP